MKQSKGFTIIELLITLVIACIVIWLLASAFHRNPCDQYRNAPITEIPHSCVEYLLRN